MPGKQRIHWLGPLSMLAALITGFGFALAHHFFYERLNGSEIPSGTHAMGGYSSGVSKQQSNTSIGTALAFAVKTCLVLAVSIAYVQVFWKALADQSSNKPFTLQSIDNSYAALRNVTLLVNLSVWRRFPLLLALALAAWLIPIVSIITPATLAVESQLITPTPQLDRHVPTISFDSLSFAASLGIQGLEHSPSMYLYKGSSQALKNIASAVGAQGAILPIDPPSANASWESEFTAPALRCDGLPDDEQIRIQQNILRYVRSSKNCYTPDGYITWFGDLPYVAEDPSANQTGVGEDAPIWIATNLQLRSSKALRFRVAVLPALIVVVKMATHLGYSACGSAGMGSDPNDRLAGLAMNSTMLQCELIRSSYHTSFRYINGNQAVETDVLRTPLEESYEVISAITGPTNASCVGFSAGYLANNSFHGRAADIDWPERCDFDPTLSRNLAYQSMVDAFFGVISGPVALDQENAGNVIKTSLLETEELDFLTDYSRATNYDRSLVQDNVQVSLVEMDRADIAGLTASDVGKARLTLAQALEDMFQNFAVSLMSSQPFRQNASTAQKVLVASETYYNVYVYTMRPLWITYAIAICCATAAVALGLHTIITAGASYSNEFSTILRVSRHAHLSHEVEHEDATGRDPLQNYLAKTTLTMSHDKDENEEVSTGAEQKTGTSASYQLLPLPGQDEPSPIHSERSSHASTR